jgi:hypothetical protein
MTGYNSVNKEDGEKNCGGQIRQNFDPETKRCITSFMSAKVIPDWAFSAFPELDKQTDAYVGEHEASQKTCTNNHPLVHSYSRNQFFNGP